MRKIRANNRPHLLLPEGPARDPRIIAARVVQKANRYEQPCPVCKAVVFTMNLREAIGGPRTAATRAAQALRRHAEATGCDVTLKVDVDKGDAELLVAGQPVEAEP